MTPNKTIHIPGLFVTGTDTEVGKTYVTSLIANRLKQTGLRVGAYKPACSGATLGTDGRHVWNDVESLVSAIEQPELSQHVCPQRFVAPLAPPVAADAEGRSVDARLLRDGARWWNDQADVLVVEGVGGFLCPMTEDETIADLAVDFALPLIVVARGDLGTINHTLLTIEAALHRGLRVAGVVMNCVHQDTAPSLVSGNVTEIAGRTSVPVLGTLDYLGRKLLHDGMPVPIDWWSLANGSKPD